MSPAFSSRAFFDSIMPAPVLWRRACTSLAVNFSLLVIVLSRQNAAGGFRRRESYPSSAGSPASSGEPISSPPVLSRAAIASGFARLRLGLFFRFLSPSPSGSAPRSELYVYDSDSSVSSLTGASRRASPIASALDLVLTSSVQV